MSKQVYLFLLQLKRLHVYVNTTQFQTQTLFPLKSLKIFKPRQTYYKLPDLCGEAVCRFKSNPCWESCQSYVVVPPLPAAAAAAAVVLSAFHTEALRTAADSPNLHSLIISDKMG